MLIVVCLCRWWAQANPGTSSLLQSDQSQRPIAAKTASDWLKVLLSLVPVPLNGYLAGPSREFRDSAQRFPPLRIPPRCIIH